MSKSEKKTVKKKKQQGYGNARIGQISEENKKFPQSSTEILNILKKTQDMADFESIPPFIRSKIESTVQNTIQQKRLFALGSSKYLTVKDTLLRRGWIQKYECEDMPTLSKKSTCKKPKELEERYIQHLLEGVPVNFIWTRYVPEWREINPNTLVNRIPRVDPEDFCTKIGLNKNLQNAYWFHEDGLSTVQFPRTYNLQKPMEMTSFIEDFVITACISLLKIIVMEKSTPTELYNIFHEDGKVPLDIIYFSIKKCDDYITFREHKDIDDKLTIRDVYPSKNELLETYGNFLRDFYIIADQEDSFQMITPNELNDIYNACISILQSLPKFWPQIDSDGYRNLWLVKDSVSSCGEGVWIVRKLTDIIAVGSSSNTSEYIVQKYIERPLLIHDVKFDIRQWFLLSRVHPLQIWMYRTCYLRFSSQPFTLDDTHESVHLCNNSIQKKYAVHPNRHPHLPKSNMWDSTTFRNYLVDIGEDDKWGKVIYPGMRASIIAALQVSQEDFVDRPNSFELYGADFMLTEDFTPWLIEINSSPAMHASTSVTRKLCTQCFRDSIKVVIDYRKSQQAQTGDFELIYNQSYFFKQIIPQRFYSNIVTYGTKLKLNMHQNQMNSLPIMDFMKMRKWKNLLMPTEDDVMDIVKKNLKNEKQRTLKAGGHKDSKRLAIENKSNTSININVKQQPEAKKKVLLNTNNKSKHNPSLKNTNITKIENQRVESSMITFLRSSQKIKYVSVPQIMEVNFMYFQVHERMNEYSSLAIVPQFKSYFDWPIKAQDDFEGVRFDLLSNNLKADYFGTNNFAFSNAKLGNGKLNEIFVCEELKSLNNGLESQVTTVKQELLNFVDETDFSNLSNSKVQIPKLVDEIEFHPKVTSSKQSLEKTDNTSLFYKENHENNNNLVKKNALNEMEIKEKIDFNKEEDVKVENCVSLKTKLNSPEETETSIEETHESLHVDNTSLFYKENHENNNNLVKKNALNEMEIKEKIDFNKEEDVKVENCVSLKTKLNSPKETETSIEETHESLHVDLDADGINGNGILENPAMEDEEQTDRAQQALPYKNHILNIYLKLKRLNIDSNDNRNESFFQLETVDSCTKYTFYVKRKDINRYEKEENIYMESRNNDDPKQDIMDTIYKGRESTDDLGRVLDEFVETGHPTFNREYQEQTSQSDKFLTIQQHSNSNLCNQETNNLRKKVLKKIFRDRLRKLADSRQQAVHSNTFHNNRGRNFGNYLTMGIIISSIFVFLGYTTIQTFYLL